MVPPASIDAFLAVYEVGADGRPLESAEHDLLRDALIDFLVNEQWLAPNPPGDDFAAGLRELAASPPAPLKAESIAMLHDAAATITDLAARLRRREHANHIMREQLAILSEALRQARSAARPG